MLEAAFVALRERLPVSWELARDTESGSPPGGGRVDAVWRLRGPGAGDLALVIEAKQIVESRDVPAVRDQLQRWLEVVGEGVGVVVGRYLPGSVRDRLADAGLSYIDATGNVLVRAESPALFIADRGADSDPWRGPGRPRGTLKGEPAAKTVRALLDYPGPWRVRDLVAASAASTGSVYRVIEFLEREALAVRDTDGLIVIPDWVALLRRWSEDYETLHTNAVTSWIAPRGLPALLDRARASDDERYAFTGTIAAAAWAEYAPARSALVYTTRPESIADAWGLRATDTGANVLLIDPAYPVVLERSRIALDGLRVAAPTQVAVDLLTGPGRAPSEGEALLEWMRTNERAWR